MPSIKNFVWELIEHLKTYDFRKLRYQETAKNKRKHSPAPSLPPQKINPGTSTQKLNKSTHQSFLALYNFA